MNNFDRHNLKNYSWANSEIGICVMYFGEVITHLSSTNYSETELYKLMPDKFSDQLDIIEKRLSERGIRQSGYYWVKLKVHPDQWACLYYFSSQKSWFTQFFSQKEPALLLYDIDFSEINETRILAPDEGKYIYVDGNKPVSIVK